AEDASRQQARCDEIGGVFRPPRHLVGPVDHRHVAADIVRGHDFVHGETPPAWSPAAYFTASMILTSRVQRKMLLPGAARISPSLGGGLRRSKPADAMMNPGVQ